MSTTVEPNLFIFLSFVSLHFTKSFPLLPFSFILVFKREDFGEKCLNSYSLSTGFKVTLMSHLFTSLKKSELYTHLRLFLGFPQAITLDLASMAMGSPLLNEGTGFEPDSALKHSLISLPSRIITTS